jgi:hypothetical protein
MAGFDEAIGSGGLRQLAHADAKSGCNEQRIKHRLKASFLAPVAGNLFVPSALLSSQ